MKKILFITFILLSFISAKADIHNKKIEKSFKLEDIKELVVENTYGKIEIEQWDKDEIEIKVDIRVEASNAEKVNSFLSKIDVAFVKKSTFLNIKTTFTDDFKLSNLTNKLFSGGSVKVDYVIYMPKNLSLKLINECGDIFIGDYVGALAVDIKEGDLKIASALGSSSINVKKGNVNINSLGISNCFFEDNDEVNIAKVEKINIDAKHSKVNISEAKSVVITSNRGDCNFGSIGSLRGSSSMTDYIVQDIGEEIVFDLWFGSLNVRNIHNMFSLVDVKTVRAKTGLTFMEGSSYDVKIRHHKNVSLDLPAGMNLTKTNTTENNVFVSEGKYGDNNKFNSKLNINASGCKLYIQ